MRSDTAHEDLAEEQLTLGKALRKYPKIAGYCLGLSVAIIGWGYGLTVVGSVTAADTFREDFGSPYNGQQIIPSLWLSLWLALPPASAAVGSVAGGWLGDKIGRKFTLMAGSIISIIAVAIIFFSGLTDTQHGKRAALTAGLSVQGFSVGLIKAISITYVSEVTPTSLRGPAMGLFPTFTLFGQCLGAVIVLVINDIPNQWGYMGAFGSIWVLSGALFILSCFLPDTPARLIRMRKDDKALAAAKALYAPRVDPYKALEKTRHTIREEEAISADATYVTCFKGTNLRRTLLVILANVTPSIFGLDFLSNGSYFVTLAGLPSRNALILTIAGVVAGCLANLGGVWILSRATRRKTIMVSMGTAGILYGAVGASGFWAGRTPAWVAGILMVVIIVVCGLGCWPGAYAVMAETSSLRLRSLTQGLGGVATQAASTAMAVILPYIYNPDAAALGMRTAFIYFGLCLLAVGLIWFVLPEMKDRSIEEIDHMFELKLPARQFRHWEGESRETRSVSSTERF
ncbi:sugar transporter domain-containing protein [Sarocladium implicatum]|nr:sugar transporter domain-containing protein [Sarocladium implicatum]